MRAGCFETLVKNLRRYGGPWQQLKALLFEPRVWASLIIVVVAGFIRPRLPAIVRWLLQLAARPNKVLVDIASSIELPPQVAIGPGLFIPHTGYIVVGSTTTIGRHCTLTQGVNIGTVPADGSLRTPDR